MVASTFGTCIFDVTCPLALDLAKMLEMLPMMELLDAARRESTSSGSALCSLPSTSSKDCKKPSTSQIQTDSRPSSAPLTARNTKRFSSLESYAIDDLSSENNGMEDDTTRGDCERDAGEDSSQLMDDNTERTDKDNGSSPTANETSEEVEDSDMRGRRKKWLKKWFRDKLGKLS
jgi:hypothetical protein